MGVYGYLLVPGWLCVCLCVFEWYMSVWECWEGL